jgi:hypothetical protein
MDMRFGTWNVGGMNRAGSLRAIVEEISKYNLNLVGVQDLYRGKNYFKRGYQPRSNLV